MKYYIKRKKKKTNECDGGAAIDAGMAMGMGPVIVDGGPDRFDNIVWPVQTQSYPVMKNKRYRARKRKKR